MRISKRGQITIPKHLRERFGLYHDVEVEVTPTNDGLLIQRRAEGQHPVDRVYGSLERVPLERMPLGRASASTITWRKSGDDDNGRGYKRPLGMKAAGFICGRSRVNIGNGKCQCL